MTKRLAPWLIWALAPVLAACPQNLSIDLVPGSTVEDLRFKISNHAGTADSGELLLFKVIEFGGIHGPGAETTLWEIALDSSGSERVGEVRYGMPPAGFRTEIAPSGLPPGGRYYATGGSAGVEFRVARDGTVTEFNPANETDPFSASGLRQEDVERFWEALRRGLQLSDPDLLADLVHYPLRFSEPDSSWLVSDRQELIREFEHLFPPELRARVVALRVEDLFSTSRGVVVASGVLWIGGACSSAGMDPCPPAIFELNHFDGSSQ